MEQETSHTSLAEEEACNTSDSSFEPEYFQTTPITTKHLGDLELDAIYTVTREFFSERNEDLSDYKRKHSMIKLKKCDSSIEKRLSLAYKKISILNEKLSLAEKKLSLNNTKLSLNNKKVSLCDQQLEVIEKRNSILTEENEKITIELESAEKAATNSPLTINHH